jgi:hypothetical protein
MRVRFALFFLCSLGICQGCNLAKVATRVAYNRTVERIDDCRERARNVKWAKAAWEDFAGSHSEASLSEDFGAGFREGYADFVYRGGTGEPPPLPPPIYRRLRYQTPEGYRAIEDWFEGYRAGAASAQHDGHRRWVTGPSAMRESGQHEGPSPPAPPAKQLPPATEAEQLPRPMERGGEAPQPPSSPTDPAAPPRDRLPPPTEGQPSASPTGQVPTTEQLSSSPYNPTPDDSGSRAGPAPASAQSLLTQPGPKADAPEGSASLAGPTPAPEQSPPTQPSPKPEAPEGAGSRSPQE